MNEYDFDYMNYINNVPSNMKYNSSQQVNLNYIPTSQPKMKKMNQMQVLEPYQGFIRGNSFEKLYDPYKRYTPSELKPNNEKETLLFQVLQYNFALTDLNLYLDTHPNDSEAISLYNQYLAIKKQMLDKYESMYDSLTLNSDYLGTNTWKWKNNPWPWEGV